MRLSIKLPHEESVTELWIDTSVFSDDFYTLLKQAMKDITRFAIITDAVVNTMIGNRLHSHLKGKGLDVHVLDFPAGESYKTRETKQQLEDEMLSRNMGRDTCILALGGGVVTDVAGFVAATYCRGIPYVCIPTTLLGMVDAGLGGKTGLDTPHGKNLIGAFYSSQAIVVDLEMLATLPDREWINGTAECLKHGMIADPVLFQMLQQPIPKGDKGFLKEMIGRNCAIKKRVIEEDPKEKGIRRILNFGHTIGHALESVEKYQISHGEAIAIGMIVESLMSLKMGHLSQGVFDLVRQSFDKHHFPLRLSSAVTVETVRKSMGLDKKAQGNTPRFVLLKEIGSTVAFGQEYCSIVPEGIVHEALVWMCEQFKTRSKE